jgi:hypothetical protein
MRWRMTAIDGMHEHGDFRDYVLARVLSVGELKPCNADPADDLEWQTECDLKLTAHPGLNPDERAAIEQGFRFEGGELTIRVRLALAFYFIRRNNLDLRGETISPQRAQLFLINFDEIEAAAANAKEGSRRLLTDRIGNAKQ